MLGALVRLECDYARNNVRAILRAPQRLAVWLPTILVLLALYHSRLDRATLAHPHDPLSEAIATGPAIGFLFVTFAAVSAALALGGRTTIFRSPAEAVLFSNARISPLLIALWLQARKLVSSFRVLTAAVYVFAFVTPAHASAGVALRGLLLSLLAFAVPTCIQLPAFLLGRRRFAGPLRAAMWVIAALSLVLAVLVVLRGEAVIRPLAAAHLDPGVFVHSLASGDPWAAAVVAAIVGALCVSIAFLGRDAVPEFYRATTQTIVERRRARGGSRGEYAVRDSRWQMPAGPFSYVWKDWIAFRRGRGKFRFWLATLSFWCVVGTVTAFTQSRDALGVLALTCLTFLVGVAPVTAGADLANDLTKPIFWISHDRVSTRIAAITFGRAARTGLALGVAPLCAALFDDDLVLAAVSLPLAVAFAWSLQAMGTALFAYFPAELDQRGPIVYLRLMIGIVFLVPVPLVAAPVFFFAGAFAAALAAMAVALAEGGLALWVASERFERRGGAAYARFGATRG